MAKVKVFNTTTSDIVLSLAATPKDGGGNKPSVVTNVTVPGSRPDPDAPEQLIQSFAMIDEDFLSKCEDNAVISHYFESRMLVVAGDVHGEVAKAITAKKSRRTA